MHSVFELHELKTYLVILGTPVFFYLYYYMAHSAYLKKLANKNVSGVKNDLQLFLLRKLTGFIFLGFLPAIIYLVFLNGSFSKFGFTLNHLSDNYLIILGFAFGIATLLYFRHKKIQVKIPCK
jgi:hypothetical protein